MSGKACERRSLIFGDRTESRAELYRATSRLDGEKEVEC